MAKFQFTLSPYLWKTLFNLSRKNNCSIIDSIRMSILVAGLMYDCVPEEEESEKK